MATAALAPDPAPPEEGSRPELRVSAATLAALGLREGDVIVVRAEGEELVLRAAHYDPDPLGFWKGWEGPDYAEFYPD